MNADNSGWGCGPVFLAIILCALVALFGSCVVIPGIEEWQAGNAQVAAINAARDAEVARIAAERDIQISKERAQAEVQRAALDLAGRTVDQANGTLRLVLLGGFALIGIVLTTGAYLLNVRIKVG